jgi:hypothetical protein
MNAAGITLFLLRAFVSSCESNFVRTKAQRHQEVLRR